MKVPRVAGVEHLRQARATPIINRIPAIIPPSFKKKGDRTPSNKIDARSYTEKPVSFEEFLYLVRDIEDYLFSMDAALSKEEI